MADSMALGAVWPSPQMLASRITLARSRNSWRSPARGLRGEAGEDLLLAHGADAARHALPARLVAEERRDPAQLVDQVDRVVEHEHDARAERRAGGPSALHRQRQIEVVGTDEAAGRAAQQDRLEAGAAAHAARQLEQLAQRGAELDLEHAGPGDRARHAEQLATLRPLGAERGVRRPTAGHDRHDVDERLDVVDEGRLAEQPDLDRERRLVARLAAEPLDRVEDRRLLAADVRAGAAEHRDVEREPGSEDVVAEVAAGARRDERGLQRVERAWVLAAQVHPSVARSRWRSRRSSSTRSTRTDRPRSARGP